jgi:NAD(P)-dependent dehydrogenase (short-subunit alcohol dehydrogenase family)
VSEAQQLRPVEQWDEIGFDRSIDINLKGPFFLIQALLPIFANPTSIVLNGSIQARVGMANASIYAATKAALAGLRYILREGLAGQHQAREQQCSGANSARNGTDDDHLGPLSRRANIWKSADTLPQFERLRIKSRHLRQGARTVSAAAAPQSPQRREPSVCKVDRAGMTTRIGEGGIHPP